MKQMRTPLGALLALAVLAALLVTPAGAAELTVQRVEVLGVPLDLSAYTVYNEWGYATNYVRLRDVAWALQFTTDRFDVDYDGSTLITTGAEYRVVGGELTYPATDGSTITPYTAVLTVDGEGVRKQAMFIIPPGSRNGNFYYKLRDLGEAIGFDVGWSAERGIYIDTESYWPS